MTGSSTEDAVAASNTFGGVLKRGPRKGQMSMEVHFWSRDFVTQIKCVGKSRLRGGIVRTLLSILERRQLWGATYRRSETGGGCLCVGSPNEI